MLPQQPTDAPLNRNPCNLASCKDFQKSKNFR
nr:MAG TPA: hypothetical protein [Caudoviricetes sp.]